MGSIEAGIPSNFIIMLNMLKKSTTVFQLASESIAWMVFMNGYLYSSYYDNDAIQYAILKTGLNFESSTQCNPFQESSLLPIEIIPEDPELNELNLNDINILLTNKYILVFNATQTPYPLYEYDITDLYWPQTYRFENKYICQPSGLTSESKSIIWNLSDTNLTLELVPFISCQGIPIKITSVKCSDLDSTAFTINESLIIIDSGYGSQSSLSELNNSTSSTKVKINQTIVLIVTAETNTIDLISNETSLAISIINSPPKFVNSMISLRVKILEGLNLKLLYSDYCSSNSESIIISDEENDSLYLNVSINNTTLDQIQIILDKQDCQFDLYVNTSNYTPGNYSMKLSQWDIFHENDPVEISINLELAYYFPPEFTSDLPPLTKIQICTQTIINLPEIVDEDGDFSYINIKPNRNWIEVQNTNLMFIPASTQIGEETLIIELVDNQGLFNDYNLNIKIVNEFRYEPISLDTIVIKYPRLDSFDISKLLIQHKDYKIYVLVKENSKNIAWAKYDYSKQNIKIFNLTQDMYGTHNLTISIFDNCFSEFFNSSVIVEITTPRPPTAVGTILNITAYQGQEKVELNINEGIFYDEDEKFSVVINCCDNVKIYTKNSSFSNIELLNPSYIFYMKLNKIFVGVCPSSLIATDSYLQTALINFFINVLKCPQNHCLYCNGPKTIDCTECVRGFLIDRSTGECRVAQFYFDTWIIISFTIVVLLTTILSNHDVNASYVLLESITFYWMLFSVFDGNEWFIKQYLDQILVVATHFNILIFPIFKWLINERNSEGITNIFLVNCFTIIIIVIIYVIFKTSKKKEDQCNKFLFILRTQAFSKYMFWASTYMLFCAFYELFNFSELASSRVLSYIFTLSFLCIGLLFAYCFLIYSNEECCLCSRYSLISNIRKEFCFLDDLKLKDYILIIRYNFGRKVILSVTFALQIKFKLSPFLFTFAIISVQSMYPNLIIGLCQFKSSITRGLIVLNEIIMILFVLIASIEYLNESFSSNSHLNKLEDYLLILVRLHILSIICVELSRIIWAAMSNATFKIISCIFKKIKK